MRHRTGPPAIEGASRRVYVGSFYRGWAVLIRSARALRGDRRLVQPGGWAAGVRNVDAEFRLTSTAAAERSDVPADRTLAMLSAAFPNPDTHYERVDGNDHRGPIYFLPWNMDFETARWLGLIIGSKWQACYRLPRAMVSPDPELCASCIEAIEHDVL